MLSKPQMAKRKKRLKISPSSSVIATTRRVSILKIGLNQKTSDYLYNIYAGDY